jgi:hypothetical protein
MVDGDEGHLREANDQTNGGCAHYIDAINLKDNVMCCAFVRIKPNQCKSSLASKSEKIR